MFAAICTAVAMDLAFTNIGLSILPLAFQQAIKATSPMVTTLLEFIIHKTHSTKEVYMIVFGICLGPIIMGMDKRWTSDSQMWYGTLMLGLSVIAGAFKYVLAHAAIKKYKSDMGILGFTIWMEIFAAIILLPWSLLNGEMKSVIFSDSANVRLILGTAAFGGVRILSQFYFLGETSATSLAISNIAIQVGLTVAGVVLFHDVLTICVILGSSVTFVMTSSFVYLKAVEHKYSIASSN
jgi:drug/metabolite transporter (DMT)-like permease